MKNLNPFKPLAIALLLCTALVSCRKKEKIEVATPKLVKIEQGLNSYLAVSYNVDRTISKITDVEGDFITETTFTYDAEKRPIIGNAGDHQLKFVYEGGKLKRINTINTQNDALLGFMEFNYINNRLAETWVSANVNGNIIAETKLSYQYYPNGDIQQTTLSGLDPTDGTFSVFSIHRFEYDQRVNPLLAASQFFAGIDWNPSTHNVVKETILEPNETVKETITTTYTYDGKTGLPLTAIEKAVPVDGDPSTITKKFIYN